MKVLLTTVDPVEVGRGHYTHIRELVEGLERRGVAVTMLFGYAGDPQIRCKGGFIDTGARLTRQDKLSYRLKDFGNQYMAMWYIRNYIRRYGKRYDIIYGRDWILGAIGRHLMLPTISEFNGVASQLRMYKNGILNQIYTRLLIQRERRAVIDSSRIICVSESILRHLAEEICPGCFHKMQVIDNGVNLGHYRFKKTKFMETRLKIAFIGSFSYWHGIEYIVPTFRPVLEKHKYVDAVFIGSGPNLKMVKSGLDDFYRKGRVEFAGLLPIEEAANRLNRCHIGFSPHKGGVLGAPLKIREYCAAGLALVTSGIAGTEFIKEKDLGLVVRPGHIFGFQIAFESLLENRTKLFEMGTRAREYAERHFSWDDSVGKVYDACEQVLDGMS